MSVTPPVPGYRAIRRLGSGGMCQVFLAEGQSDGLQVAIKCLLPAFSHEAVIRQRFLREAKTTSTLNHPNIIKILDFVEEGDECAIVMEYIDGPSLKDVMVRNPVVPCVVAARIAIEILAALQAAHAAGIIHRDLKPSNVLMRRDGMPVLTDFGIAHAPEATRLTRTGDLIGTPAYMSPEQASGEPVDARSDLFSLGTMVFEMVSGQSPFFADSAATMMMRILDGRSSEVLELNPTVDVDFDTIVRRLMDRDPEHRYGSSEEAQAAFRAYLAAHDDGDGRETLRRLVDDGPALVREIHDRMVAMCLQEAGELIKLGGTDAASRAYVELSKANFLSPSDADILRRMKQVEALLQVEDSPGLQGRIAEVAAKLSAQPDSPALMMQLARLYRQAGQPLKVQTLYRRLQRTRPGDTYVLRQVGNLIGETRLPQVHKPVTPAPLPPEPVSALIPWRWIIAVVLVAAAVGVVYVVGSLIDREQGKLENKVMSQPLLQPDEAPQRIDAEERAKRILMSKAEKEEQSGNSFEAIRLYDEFASRYPNAPETQSARLSKALLLSKLMRWMDAEPLLRELADASPRADVSARARLELAKILEKKELYREAAAEWRKLAGSTPDSDPYHQMALDRAAENEGRASQVR